VLRCEADAERPELLRIAVRQDGCGANAIIAAAIAAGASIHGFREELRRLDHAFMDLTTPGVRS
jgi:hypothetical protein